MGQHGMGSITTQNDLATHVTPLRQVLPIIQFPLANNWIHGVDYLLHILRPPFILLL